MGEGDGVSDLGVGTDGRVVSVPGNVGQERSSLGRGRVDLVMGSRSDLGSVGAFEIAKRRRQLCKQI